MFLCSIHNLFRIDLAKKYNIVIYLIFLFVYNKIPHLTFIVYIYIFHAPLRKLYIVFDFNKTNLIYIYTY